MLRARFVASVLITIAACGIFPLSAQVRGHGFPPGSDADDQRAVIERQQRQLRKQEQKERFKRIQADSTKLLELATELKQYVDKANENVLSLEVIKKAEEMEKLAHDVKSRMRNE